MSFTKGISFHHETNASSQPNITNNISINASSELSQSNPSVIVESANESKVQEVQTQSIEPNNENTFLKKVLSIYMNQKFYFSGKFIVLTPDELLDLIQTLLPNKSVVIRTNDIEDVINISIMVRFYRTSVQKITIGSTQRVGGRSSVLAFIR